MLSDDSELTELSLDDSTSRSYAPNARKPAPRKQKRDGYKIRNILKPGRTTQYTAKALYDQIHQNDIELDPEYQRDVVWSDAKQIGLIDSIFRNFYVPPIIFSVTTEDDGTEKRICIDGKQRLTSIQKFIGGLIPHRDTVTNEKLWFVDSHNGPKRKLLPPQYRNLFQNRQIVCIEFNELPGDLEREMFQRVQMGMALTTAEKLQAISGPWSDFVREIMEEYHTGQDGISSNMNLEKSRARDFQNIAQALFCIDNLPGHVSGTPMQLEKWLQKEEGPSDSTRTAIHDVFKIYNTIAKDPQLKAPLKKPSRVAPAEFIMAAVLIALHKNKLSLPQLSQAIGILRTQTRAEHADVRTNAKVYKTMFNIVSKSINLSILKDTPGHEVAGAKPSISKNPNTTKRKRDYSDDEDGSYDDHRDDNAEYKPRSAKKLNTPPQPASVSMQHSSKLAPSSSAQVKAEVIETKHPAPAPAGVQHSLPVSLSGHSGLEKIRTAKLKAAQMLSNTQSASSTSLASHTTVSVLPARPSVPAPSLSKVSLEAVMMTQTSTPASPSVPQSTSASNTVSPQKNGLNGVQVPRAAVPAAPFDGTNHAHYPPDYTRTGHTINDGHRRNEPLRPSREEPSEAGYRGRSTYDDRGERDLDRAYRDREPDRLHRGREPDRDRDRDRDRDKDRGWDRDHSRSSYASGRGEPYYRPPREQASEWRRTGY